jgi:hypothetical protein
MAHFAKVVDEIVKNVIVAEPEFFDTYVDDSPGEWIQTSFNTIGGIHYDPITKEPSSDQNKALRKNFAGIGLTYSREMDAFIPPKPFASWILNETTCLWESPVPYPDADSDERYEWNEENQTWDEI